MDCKLHKDRNHVFIFIYGEGNGNPLQYSCLENPVDRGTWWATVHGVTRVRKTEQLSTHACTLGIQNLLITERS